MSFKSIHSSSSGFLRRAGTSSSFPSTQGSQVAHRNLMTSAASLSLSSSARLRGRPPFAITNRLITTKAIVVEKVNAPWEWKEIELEDPQPNEVLVKVTASGICATDLHAASGGFPSPFPMIPGHEGSGKVVKVGSAVKSVKEGDSVLLSFSSCETCKLCTSGHPAACSTWNEWNFGRKRNDAIGSKPAAKSADGTEIYGAFFGQSSFGEHALVVESSVVKVPEGTDLVYLSPLGCGMQTGAGAVLNVLKPEVEASIAVYGLGAVGFSAMMAAAALGVKKVIVIDIDPARLELALTLGATHALNGKEVDVVEAVRGLTDGYGSDYAVEATGNPISLKNAYVAVSNLGKIASVGTPGPGTMAPFDVFGHVTSSKTWYGVTEGDSNPAVFIPELIKLYEEGKFPIDKLCKTFPISEIDAAIASMKTGVIKPILLF